MLTRVYGTAWPTEKQLKAYLRRLEEAKEGPPQDRPGAQALYLLAGRGSWHPAVPAQGEMLRHLMEGYVREVQSRHGYDHVWTGHLANEKLYEKSGHLEHYKDSMFPPMVDGETRYRPRR